MQIVTKYEKKRHLCSMLVAIYFFLAFFEPYYGAVLGSITKYYIFLIVAVIILENHLSIVKQPLMYPMLVWFVYKLISVLWAHDTYIFHLHLTTHVGMLLLLYSIVMRPVQKEMIDYSVTALWLGSTIISVLALFRSVSYLGVSSRQVLQLFGQTTDPNNQAAFTVIGFAIGLYYLISMKKRRVFFAFFALINVLATFLTGSRGGLVAIVGVTCIYIWLYMKDGKYKALVIALIILATFGLSVLLPRVLPADVYNRLFETIDTGGSERTEIWANAWTLINNPINFLFGSGWGSYWGHNEYRVVLHNTFLSTLCDTGMVGFLLFFAPMAKLARFFLRNRQTLPLVIFSAGMIPCLFLEAINKRFFWNAIIFLFMYYEWYVKTQDQLHVEDEIYE